MTDATNTPADGKWAALTSVIQEFTGLVLPLLTPEQFDRLDGEMERIALNQDDDVVLDRMNGAHYGAMSRTVRKIITDMIIDARPPLGP